jgi:polyvinyl alcohol dehydrogenase (cytochrome)
MSVKRFFFSVAVGLFASLAGAPAGAAEWPSLGGGPERLFYNAAETRLNADTIERLQVRWAYETGAIVTGAATVADVDLPGEGLTSVVFQQSWDGFMYALRLKDGSPVWMAALASQPGASYPNAGSVTVADIGGIRRILYGAGETLLCVDAATGIEVWRFDAGTGCLDPPNTCGFSMERNEVISTPVVVDGLVVFGMDTNDVATGKGGVYAVDETDGRLLWFFDLESGSVCTPDPGDNIRRFDGYHSELELGLPAGFLTTRSGCNFDRTPTGCGNVWSSPAADTTRQLLYFASSNCDTDDDAGTTIPPPPMPPYDEAIFALNYDGTPAWKWRPREVDNMDLAFGALPQLFTIDFDGLPREVVGIGNKDGTYYVIDRDGVNEVSGVAWNDADPSALPYWQTNLVPGGVAGGILGTPSIDTAGKRIYVNTAPGFNPATPQQPTVHALDADDGSIVWQNTAEGPNADSSFAPTGGSPGYLFVGNVLPPGTLRVYDSATGDKLFERELPGQGIASGPTVIDGHVIVGGGIGERNANENSPAHITSLVPHAITALCAAATEGCPANLLGKKLLIKDRLGDPSKRKIVALAKDATHAFNPPTGAEPTVTGAQLRVINPMSSEEQTMALPAVSWTALGNPPGSKGYKYKDPKTLNGPCKSVLIKPGKLVKANCKGSGIGYSLDEANQGEVAVTLRMGLGDEVEYCMRFGGTVTKDLGTGASTSGNALFKAKNAERPDACP